MNDITLFIYEGSMTHLDGETISNYKKYLENELPTHVSLDWNLGAGVDRVLDDNGNDTVGSDDYTEDDFWNKFCNSKYN